MEIGSPNTVIRRVDRRAAAVAATGLTSGSSVLPVPLLTKPTQQTTKITTTTTFTITDADNQNLSMYYTPSTNEEITIEEFYKLGVQRLSVLRALESLKEKHASEPKKYAQLFVEEIGRIVPFFTNGLLASQIRQARRDDRISHFLLRLAFCQSEDMSQWFVRQETELFRMRFHLETQSRMLQFLRANGICPEEVSENEKSDMLGDLSQALTMSTESVLKSCIFKVDCWDVIELFASFHLLLKAGIAYISSNELVALVAPKFRENICASLASARRKVGPLLMQHKLVPLLRHIVGDVSSGRKKEYNDSDSISPHMIDSLAKESFPLCMREIHSHLRAEHHLRHFARNQYGLFLKGIGLSMESALDFFRAEFIKKMDSDKFTKQYAYNIRHMYGKEGNRVERKPLSCATIILGSGPSAPGDCHGCPFRHMETKQLEKRLSAVGLAESRVEEIVDLSKAHRFDRACTKYFEFTHNVPDLEEMMITHPNQYFTLSRRIRNGGGGDGEIPPVAVEAIATTSSQETNDDDDDIQIENCQQSETGGDD